MAFSADLGRSLLTFDKNDIMFEDLDFTDITYRFYRYNLSINSLI